jgi:ATP-dependent protease ClpP protease subunit
MSVDKCVFNNVDMVRLQQSKSTDDNIDVGVKYSDDCSSGSDYLDVSVVNNDIYLYRPIDKNASFNLRRAFKELECSLNDACIKYNLDTLPDINIHINSCGGLLLEGFNIVDLILGSNLNVNTYVEGSAASAASIISIVGSNRYMTKNSFILIHELRSASFGKYSEIKDDVSNCDLFMQKIRGFYEQYTNIPVGELDNILKHDLYWDSDKCLEYGLVDFVV